VIEDEKTPLGCATHSRRAGTRALPDLHHATSLGRPNLLSAICYSAGHAHRPGGIVSLSRACGITEAQDES
jgi:hypothetical protein